MKKTMFGFCAAAAMVFGGSADASLLISAVVDGTNSGGIPKAIELIATEDIADLSVFALDRDTNGAGPFDSLTALPSVSLNAGDYFYISAASSTTTILEGLGFTVGLEDSIAGINGDDILAVALTADGTIIDSFGQVGQGDTDFYANSYAVRSGSSIAPLPAGSVDATNFVITGYTTDADFAANGFGTFVIPEPASLALVGLGGLMMLSRRRSQA